MSAAKNELCVRVRANRLRALLPMVLLAAACSAPDPGGETSSGGTKSGSGGGTGNGKGGSTSGGATGNGTGGSTSGGASSGGASMGGASTGGTNGAGGSSAGAPGAGGSSNANGGAQSGGAQSGGTKSSGGSGGDKSSGGASNGGSANGGTKASGGSGSGGDKSSGGASSGGSSSGGSGSGGAKASGGSGSGGAATGGATSTGGSCSAGTDAKALLRMYRPSSSSLATLFDDYVDKEIGTPIVATAGTGTARTITQTIVVPPCAVYDGKGERLTAQGMGDGSQDEGQKPIFILTPGAGVKNVKIAAPGCEGIHMMGNNTVENITWEDVGEDAASVRSYFPGGKITITGGSAKSSADKTFQFNVTCDVTIKNFTATNIGKLVRQNGGKDFPLNITLDTVTANDVKDAVVMSDSPQCIVRHHALTTNAADVFVGPMKVTQF